MLAHKAIFAAALAVSCTFLGGSAQAADSNRNNWQVVAPQGSGFSILMPGNPAPQTFSGKYNGADLVSHIYRFDAPDGREDYLVGYVDYPSSMNTASILEANRKSEIGTGRVLWEQNTTLNGHPGKRIAATDGTRAWVSEFYVAGNRGYAARYTTRNLMRAVLDAAPFLGSFQLTE
jgi:hypothetical protein